MGSIPQSASYAKQDFDFLVIRRVVQHRPGHQRRVPVQGREAGLRRRQVQHQVARLGRPLARPAFFRHLQNVLF